jgi:hypothetical protein
MKTLIKDLRQRETEYKTIHDFTKAIVTGKISMESDQSLPIYIKDINKFFYCSRVGERNFKFNSIAKDSIPDVIDKCYVIEEDTVITC